MRDDPIPASPRAQVLLVAPVATAVVVGLLFSTVFDDDPVVTLEQVLPIALLGCGVLGLFAIPFPSLRPALLGLAIGLLGGGVIVLGFIMIALARLGGS